MGEAGNDLLYGFIGGDKLFGGADDDTLNGGAGNDELMGEANDDLLQGGSGSDVYHFRSGDGSDIITECKRTPDDVDILRFGSGISPAQVILKRSNGENRNDLTLEIRDSDDSVTIKDFFGLLGPQVERVEFSDGSCWDMAAFAQEYGGVGDLSQIHANINGGALGQNHCGAVDDSSIGGACDERFDDHEIGHFSRLCLTGEKGTVIEDTLQDGQGGKTFRYGHGITPADVTLKMRTREIINDSYPDNIQVLREIKGFTSNIKNIYVLPNVHDSNTTEFYDGTVWTAQDIRKHLLEGIPLPTTQPAVPSVGGSIPQLHQEVAQFMAAGEVDDASVSSVSLPLATAPSHQHIQQSPLTH